MIKNDHMIWALGQSKDNDGDVLIIGLTDSGLELLRSKKTLLVNPPSKVSLKNIVCFYEPTKDDLKETFKKTGLPIKEGDIDKL